MNLMLWCLVIAIGSVKILSFAVSVRRALRPRVVEPLDGNEPIDPPDGGPDWDWWERDLLPPDPSGDGALDDRPVLVLS